MSFADLYRRGAERMVFEHVAVHARLTSGSGTAANSALPPAAERIAAGLDRADAHLERGLRDSEGRWRGRGADLGADTTPLSRAVRALRALSDEIEDRVLRQAEQFARVRAMPGPQPVEPIELGGSGTQRSFLDPQSDKELHERVATDAEEAARRQYERYRADVVPAARAAVRRASVPSPRAR